MQRKKVGIIGLGPVGLILAVKLHEAGCDVAICDKDEFKVKKIRESGIILQHVFQSKTELDKVFSSVSEMHSMDLDYLVFSLKSYQTASALKEAELLKSDKLTVIAAQNGIDVEEILIPAFGEKRTLRMVVNYAGNMVSPNTVRVSFFTPPNYIGSVDDNRSVQAAEFAEILNSVGFSTESIDSFELVKRTWEKTILNASLSALCGVGRLTMAEAVADTDSCELIEQIISEGIEVAEKEKIRFPDDFVRKCMRYLKAGGDHFPSLAVDIINHRQTEIDYFNGKIVEYGKKHYVKTSLNLAFTNMVKAMTSKNVLSRLPGVMGELNKKVVNKGLIEKERSMLYYKETNCFLGIDLGSAFTKFTVIDDHGTPVFRYVLETLNKDRQAMKAVLQAVHGVFNIKYSCATGYGRKHFADTDIIKTEINCAAAGVSGYFSGPKTIIDIGGEDIKVIQCDNGDHVANFYMNDKCAAGTGAFLSEISERAGINIADMSALAAHSEFDKELNSFCTVFAKTEIMNWVFDGMPLPDIARGIYISIANKVAKMKMVPGIPVYMIGGVTAYHPYVSVMLGTKLGREIIAVDNPQHVVSFGAALMAQQAWRQKELHPAKDELTTKHN